MIEQGGTPKADAGLRDAGGGGLLSWEISLKADGEMQG